MIIMDFLILRMPGMVDRLSVSISYQNKGRNEVSIPFGEAVELHSQSHRIAVGLVVLPPEIILPGLLLHILSNIDRMV